jgi:hypothetical protein
LVDHQVLGKIGRVTGRIAPGRIGEVMVPVRGGTEAFYAFAAGSDETIEEGRRVVVMDYEPPRTVVVTPLE